MRKTNNWELKVLPAVNGWTNPPSAAFLHSYCLFFMALWLCCTWLTVKHASLSHFSVHIRHSRHLFHDLIYSTESVFRWPPALNEVGNFIRIRGGHENLATKIYWVDMGWPKVNLLCAKGVPCFSRTVCKCIFNQIQVDCTASSSICERHVRSLSFMFSHIYYHGGCPIGVCDVRIIFNGNCMWRQPCPYGCRSTHILSSSWCCNRSH